MKLIYLAHPVRGDVLGNLARAKRWWRWIETSFPDTVVIAPWITVCEIFDDADEAQRMAGLRRGCAVVVRCDEIWLVGGRVSNGMRVELEAAAMTKVKVVDLTRLGEEPPVAWKNVGYHIMNRVVYGSYRSGRR